MRIKQNFLAKQIQYQHQNEKMPNFLIQSRSLLPIKALWCKKMRMQKIENLTLGNLTPYTAQ